MGITFNKYSLARNSGKSATIRESNHGSGVCKEHAKTLHFVSPNWRKENIDL